MINPEKEIIEVISYSGYASNERPIYFYLGNNRMVVEQVQKRWRDQESDFFKIIADNGVEYLMEWNRGSDQWFLSKNRLEG